MSYDDWKSKQAGWGEHHFALGNPIVCMPYMTMAGIITLAMHALFLGLVKRAIKLILKWGKSAKGITAAKVYYMPD